MATKKYNTMHQHEPLSVPRKWSGEEIRFATQLEETLDDLYRIINRLKLSDLAGELKLTDKDGNETIAISASGDVTAKSLTADSIVIDGTDLATYIRNTVTDRIILSSQQPDMHGVIWIKPVSGSGESGEVLEEVTFSGQPSQSAAGSTVTFALSLSDKTGSITGDTCKYHASIRLRNTRGKRLLNSISMRLTSWYGGEIASEQIMNVTGLNKLLNAGDYIVVENDESTLTQELPNLARDYYIVVELTLGFSGDGVIAPAGESTVRAYTTKEDQSGDAVKTCEVYFIS